MRAGWIGAALLLAQQVGTAGQADAGLTLCNDAGDPALVAIAYTDNGDWVSEGWWRIAAGSCAVVQAGPLTRQHYYYTVSAPGFAGEGYGFCTQNAAFTLTGADRDCAARGAESRDFAEIDTGADATDFTFDLSTGRIGTQPEQAPATAPDATLSDTNPDKVGAATGDLAAAAIPSFEPGLMGEPFTVVGIVQGCGPTEGGDGCTFYAEGARWIAYSAGQSNPAALAALATMPVGAAVIVAGDMISLGDITVEAAIASLEPGDDPYAAERAAMQGAWVSADDPQSRIEITGSEQTDLYAGEPMGVSMLRLGAQCGETSGGTLLTVQVMGGDPMDAQCFAVLSVDASRMELSYIGRGNTLTYVRP